MKCDFCEKNIKNKIGFANIFKSSESICQECKKILTVKINKINYTHYYLANYEDIKEIIYDIKYFGHTEQAKKFSLPLKNFLKNNNFDLITLAPTNKTREAIRGFNHVALICQICKINYTEIFSEKYRPKQAKIHSKRNFHEVSILDNKKDFLKNVKSILIIDDIFTSGKTLLSLARKLENFNSHISISFLTLAKSNKNF
ncbi:ComF family protein [Gemella sp. zg-1178]|uniref:ComF family protein n=1 Tax=Gemella sp. zg-1178 TaxID=2840372 RepID=UPI001C04A5DE|nr:phosphoribosyltransferase family protein [Gemella sp. zg-1178]MBU0278878.1 ComF family protein [Gemella sp. zg-1178]